MLVYFPYIIFSAIRSYLWAISGTKYISEISIAINFHYWWYLNKKYNI